MIITVFVADAGVPQPGLTDLPTIDIYRTDTQALVVNGDSMTEIAGGHYVYDFTTVDGLEYAADVDADPLVTGQVSAQDRFYAIGFSGTTEARQEIDIPAILVDTGTTIPGTLATLETEASAAARAATNQTEHDATQALITALNDLAIADVQTALTNQGYTAARAPNLDNLDVTVSSRESEASAATRAATNQTEHDATQAAIAALNDLDDVAIAAAVWQTLLSTHDGVVGSVAEALRQILNLEEADESFTTNLATKFVRGTSTVLLQKNVTGAPSGVSITMTE